MAGQVRAQHGRPPKDRRGGVERRGLQGAGRGQWLEQDVGGQAARAPARLVDLELLEQRHVDGLGEQPAGVSSRCAVSARDGPGGTAAVMVVVAGAVLSMCWSPSLDAVRGDGTG
jgi:hypothetical protein